ncbi:MAG: zinc ABC transporter substrate-binding protein [Treponema sp.]|jgi:zinc transport system substrate-binding protein|nr:zinc ABC transporter substrate-binding protein [Treponema sp.]
MKKIIRAEGFKPRMQIPFKNNIPRPFRAWLLIAVVCSLLFAACSRQTSQQGLLIAVSIPPQEWFVSRIAGDKAATLVLAGQGQNPHNYEPTPKQIQSLAAARAWVLSGSEFEISLRGKVASLFPNLLLVDGTEGVRFRLLEPAAERTNVSEGSPPVDHDHDGDDDHSSLEIDKHTWLGREPAKILAAHITDTLSLLDGANADYYFEQYEILVREIDDEFDKLKIILAPLEGRSVFVYHPSFGYFLDEFGIHQEAVETGGKEPGPRDLQFLILRLKEEQAAALFVQAQFPANAAKTLAAAVDAELIALDPLAGNWLDNIRRMGDALQKAAP